MKRRANRKDRRRKGHWAPLPKRRFRLQDFLLRHQFDLIYPGLLLPVIILSGMFLAGKYFVSREEGWKIARDNEGRAVELLKGISHGWRDSADIVDGSQANPHERYPIPPTFLEEARKRIGYPASVVDCWFNGEHRAWKPRRRGLHVTAVYLCRVEGSRGRQDIRMVLHYEEKRLGGKEVLVQEISFP